MATPSSPTKFGPFVLDRKLAEGGMAELFLARQQGLGGFEKQVVVKRILPALSTDQAFVQMFLNEARLAARLSHSNVVSVIEAGEIDGQYYIAMEYIDGRDLRMFYDETEETGLPTPPGVACRVIADLLAGLHYAHTRTDEAGRPLGIVHRDVSPANVLVTRTGTVKIVDFGIAKATRAAAQHTQAGQVKGKIAYLSPEQAMGRPLDARSDVFACGILLWELCTGARLFSRPNDMAAILAITEDDIPVASAIRRELPEALDRLLMQALARPVVERFPSAQEMQRELEALIRAQGWAGDRRSLERYVQARLGSHTPMFGVDAMRTVRESVDAAEFADGPTMLASSAQVAQAPRSAAPRVQAAPDKATIAMTGQDAPAPSEPVASVRARSLPPTALAAPVPTPAALKPRTPSGMRSMPATPGPAPPPYSSTAPVSAYPETFDGPTAQGGGRTLRRVILVATIAAAVSIGTIAAVDWTPQPTIATTPAPPPHRARLVIEVPEPATVEVEGRKTRVEAQTELDIPIGRQLSITATTTRAGGKQATRTIALPPAAAGERIPLRIAFPK